ncbi:hypothetical protein AKO1_009188 [Acrasis kona]|uniref:Peptidase S9 prolyl oligopeptidase catalytic domain-containing protein n=1 Tax=Acrasis kona TaxID=1008807 RepID=A0AAW2ZHW8_9EUKA
MGQLIGKFLFQPPEPPSYQYDNSMIWLKCPPVKEKKKGGGLLSSSESDPDFGLDSSSTTISKRELQNCAVDVPGLFLPYNGSDLCLLYSHGNATDLGQMKPYLDTLRSFLKINVFSYEYQGYGISRPHVKPTEARVNCSIEAAVEYLFNVKQIPYNKIIVFGTSLGTGPTTYIAAKDKYNFRGVILQSPFTSVVRIKFNKLPDAIDLFKNVDIIDKIECPVLIIHGKSDDVVPFEHGQILFDKLQKKAQYKPLFIDYAGHNNIIEIMSMERYLKHLFKFIIYLNEYQQKLKQSQEAEAQVTN